MNTPFFTVIVVSFNAGDKLHKTLRSILEQTFEDYEIIVKDGLSTDGSTNTIPPDPRIRLIRKKDEGIYPAMNQALQNAVGEYIYFLNCGDVLHGKEVLGEVALRIREDTSSRRQQGTPAYNTIYYGDVIEMQTGQRVAANPDMDHFAMYRYLPCHQACFYARDLFAARQFDTTLRVRADYEHFLWSVIRSGARTVAMPLVVADYEGGGYSESPEGRKRSKEEHERITKEYFTPAECRRFRAYLVLSLQPLREKLARGRVTAALYDRVKNAIYGKKRGGTE